MEPYWTDDQVTLHLGDCLEVLAGMDEASVDAIVTDPPYGLEFMGVAWDTMRDDGKPRTRNEWQDFGSREHARHPSEVAAIQRRKGLAFYEFSLAWSVECLRALKPGGHLLAFGGTRTYHRLACAIEDAGFEIRDSMHWIYGSGFPKSLNVSKAIDKAAGAERPVVGPNRWAGRNPRADHARQGLTFADDSYVRPADPPATAPATDDAACWDGWGTALKPAHEPIVVARKPLAGTVAQNVLEHGTGALNINGCLVGSDVRTNHAGGASSLQRVSRVEHGYRPTVTTSEGQTSEATGRWPANVLLGPGAAAELDAQSGVLTSGANPTRRGSDKFRDAYGEFAGQQECTPHRGADTGGASRFFPVFRYEAKAGSAQRPRGDDGTAHPTVKPVDLMAWLVRLITPPGGLVLDPFAGSGTTAEACIVEGFRSVLIEKDPAYCELIRKRLSKPIQPAMI